MIAHETDDHREPSRQVPGEHERPTDAGWLDPEGREVPGTGIYGDETLVKPAEGVGRPGIAKEIPVPVKEDEGSKDRR